MQLDTMKILSCCYLFVYSLSNLNKCSLLYFFVWTETFAYWFAIWTLVLYLVKQPINPTSDLVGTGISREFMSWQADRRARLGLSLNSGTSLKSIKTSEPETKVFCFVILLTVPKIDWIHPFDCFWYFSLKSQFTTQNPLKVDSTALSGNLITKKEVLMECLRSLRRQYKVSDFVVSSVSLFSSQ